MRTSSRFWLYMIKLAESTSNIQILLAVPAIIRVRCPRIVYRY